MIPKVIHYCWFSGEKKPRLIRRCIRSWKKVLPDYEIKCWDANSFDFDNVPYVKQAYERKKWAFVADYTRFKVLEEYAFAINVKELKNEDTVRAPLQYNDRHKTVGFYAACPSVNRIVYDYNLPDQAIVRVKKKRNNNIEYFIMKK